MELVMRLLVLIDQVTKAGLWEGWAMGIDSSIGNNFEIHNSSGGVDSSSQLAITPSGNVGIGITAITASVNADDLQIGNGTGGNRGLTVTAQSNSGAAIYFGDADNTNMGSVRYDNSNDSMKFFTNTSERIRIDSSGNVGIGTTSPDYKLEVNGTLGVNRTDGIIFAGSLGSGIGNKITADTSNDFIFSTSLASAPYTVSERMRIATDGAIKFNSYDSTNQTGTPTYILGTDGSGNVVKVLGSNIPTTAPATPGSLVATIVGETIEIAFAQSSTSNIGYYQVWSSDDGGDYGLIAQITPTDFSATMTVVDTTFVTGGTMSYRVFAVKNGIYSSPGTVSKAYTVGALSVTNMAVVNLNTAYYIQYEKPTTRFIDHIEIWMDSQTTSAALLRSNAVLVYSGQNASYMRNVNTSSNFHQFWVEIVTS
jgi:hypothetical protein